MKPTVSNSYSGLCLLLTVLYPVYSSAIVLSLPGRGSMAWKHFTLKCGLHCPYGYDTDVEGGPICKCQNPCRNVFCFDGTVCVIKKAKNCRGGFCSHKAACKDAKSTTSDVSIPMGHNRGPPALTNEAFDIANTLQQDSSTTISGTSPVDVTEICIDQPPPEAWKCDRKEKRYYFNSNKGMCLRFRGCQTVGNNFRRRRDCKRTCISSKSKKGSLAYLNRMPSRETSNETNICLLALDDPSRCRDRTVMRWHFSLEKGTCVRVKACKTSFGNYFRKRRQCKRQCMRKNRSVIRRRKNKKRSKSRRRGILRNEFNG
ncbi:tissue factor pathway inhibitor-like [Mizuhopecten yessoensis]|uniref:Spleen trypsin inhibitor I n=1 Tax=Mizuhopecten yessoensis TaxID=6573 RepID=A0A210PGX5_MIZYE|nr:tissue factor pathway inhibitor-like [Mizuhopecten yessoensis]OWF35717.1 Spleen trypsin inhibitor I [Mizuhopecten yessoensis]